MIYLLLYNDTNLNTLKIFLLIYFIFEVKGYAFFISHMMQ